MEGRMTTKKDRTTGYFSKLETMTGAERRRVFK